MEPRGFYHTVPRANNRPRAVIEAAVPAARPRGTKHHSADTSQTGNVLASTLSQCQASISTVLKCLEETNSSLTSLAGRIARIEAKVDAIQRKAEEHEEESRKPGKRRRPKDRLAVQVMPAITLLFGCSSYLPCDFIDHFDVLMYVLRP